MNIPDIGNAGRYFKEYVGIYSDDMSALENVLENIVSQNGKEIYFDVSRLQDLLRGQNVDEADIYRISLLTTVHGFKELIASDVRTAQIDLERYIQNAVNMTGLNREVVLRLTHDIVLSTGGIMEYSSVDAFNNRSNKDEAYTFPYTMYGNELHVFESAFKNVVNSDKDVKSLNFDVLQPYLAAGVPKAKYFMGYCLLKGLNLEEDSDRGIELLEEAAESGCIEAASALGDYYYSLRRDNSWSKAYEYYTGYGAVALNEQQKDAVISIFNHKKFNKSMLTYCGLLLAVMVFSLFPMLGSETVGGAFALGIFSTLINGAIFAIGFLHYKVKPFDSLYSMPVKMLFVWFIYMIIRILF